MSIGTDRTPIAAWLLRGHSSPPQAWAEWEDHNLAMLPLGKQFAAVRLRGELVHAAMGTDDPQRFAAPLGELVDGPVIHDRTACVFYALVHSEAGKHWRHRERAVFMCSDEEITVFLGVPSLDRTYPPGNYWVVAPRFDGDLCDMTALAALVDRGSGALSLVQTQAAYAAYMSHLEQCPSCATERTCPHGARLKEDQRAARQAALTTSA